MKLSDAVSLAALLLSLIALFVNYLSGQRRDVLGIRPVLVFEYKEVGWAIHNIGSGPAMDVVFTRLKGRSVHQHVRLPALAKDAAFTLHFCRRDNIHRFVATYLDIEGRRYSSESVDDVSTSSRGFLVDRPTPPVVQWWKLPEQDS
jgi:hypothetical protein